MNYPHLVFKNEMSVGSTLVDLLVVEVKNYNRLSVTVNIVNDGNLHSNTRMSRFEILLRTHPDASYAVLFSSDSDYSNPSGILSGAGTHKVSDLTESSESLVGMLWSSFGVVHIDVTGWESIKFRVNSNISNGVGIAIKGGADSN